MTNLVWFLFGWVFASLVFGVIIGHFMAGANIWETFSSVFKKGE